MNLTDLEFVIAVERHGSISVSYTHLSWKLFVFVLSFALNRAFFVQKIRLVQLRR